MDKLEEAYKLIISMNKEELQKTQYMIGERWNSIVVEAKSQFSVDDRVQFETKRGIIVGKVVGFTKKYVKVEPENWAIPKTYNISATLLKKVSDQ